MFHRYERHHPPVGPQVVDARSARRAIARVSAERDAVARELERAQTTVASLRRRLEAREAENVRLTQALRSLNGRVHTHRAAEPNGDAVELRRRLDSARAELATLARERTVALAERDRAVEGRQRAEREAEELASRSTGDDRVQRLSADLANLRRHQSEAIDQGIRRQTTRLLVEMASVRDAVARALDASPPGGGPWQDGLLVILAKADAVFAQEGVSLTGRAGDRFDPMLHEAVGTVEEGTPDTIHLTVTSGLQRVDGTVIVPARVLVVR